MLLQMDTVPRTISLWCVWMLLFVKYVPWTVWCNCLVLLFYAMRGEWPNRCAPHDVGRAKAGGQCWHSILSQQLSSVLCVSILLLAYTATRPVVIGRLRDACNFATWLQKSCCVAVSPVFKASLFQLLQCRAAVDTDTLRL